MKHKCTEIYDEFFFEIKEKKQQSVYPALDKQFKC